MSEHFTLVETGELEQTAQPKRSIWDGYLTGGQITLFTSVWKSGKTTLLSHLLAQRKAGGVLAGRAVTAGVSVIISEEPTNLWHERNSRLGFGPRDCFVCRPFVGNPTPAQWLELIEFIKEVKSTRGIDLVVIDTLSSFLPAGAENDPRLLAAAMAPLHALTQLGLAVLLIHHPRKARAPQGMLSRGCGILSSFVDILIEMYRVRADDVHDRRRRLVAFSRDAATPASLAIELSKDGAAYAVAAETPDDDDFGQNWLPLRMVLENAKDEMTRQEIRKAWPSSFPAPSRNTLWRWLGQAFERGLIQRSGTGVSGQPFRYCLAEKLALWQSKADEPSDTAEVDAWIRQWQEQYPPPAEWKEADIRGNDIEADE